MKRSTSPVTAADMPGTPVFAIENLSIAYDRQPVLDAVHWRALPGQVIGLLGRNGAGKTTLLEAMLGLRPSQHGTASVFGEPITAMSDRTRARIGYVPQQSDLFDWLTPAQLMNYFRSFYPCWNVARVEGLLSRWDIPREKVIAKLSVGQQQRLSIIRALGPDPDFLVLDEPVASLDPAARRAFLSELVGLVLDRGTSVVFSTHILSDLERVAFDLAFLRGGRIVMQAPLDQLLDRTRWLSGAPDAIAAMVTQQALQFVDAPGEAGTMRHRRLVQWPESTSPSTSVAGVDIDYVTLDDLFMELTQ